MTESVGGVDFNAVVSNILRFGVLVSTALIAAGLLLLSVEGAGQSLQGSIAQIVLSGYGRPQLNLVTVFEGVAAAEPLSLIQLGLILLLSTPIARVVASIAMFAAEGDGLYVAFTVFVLAVLLLGIFVVGPIEAGYPP